MKRLFRAERPDAVDGGKRCRCVPVHHCPWGGPAAHQSGSGLQAPAAGWAGTCSCGSIRRPY